MLLCAKIVVALIVVVEHHLNALKFLTKREEESRVRN